MALPAGITTAELTYGQTVDFTGTELSLDLVIVPSIPLTWKATGVRLETFGMARTAAPGVAGSIALPHTNQTGFADDNGADVVDWHYVATGQYKRGDEATAQFVKPFQLPTGQTTVDLDRIATGVLTPLSAAPTAVVTSLAGITGDITEAEFLELVGEITGGGVPDNSLTLAKFVQSVRDSLAKADSALQSLPNHSHLTSAITGLDATLAAITASLLDKAALGHGHAIGDVTNLQTSLNTLTASVAANSSTITDLATEVGEKADADATTTALGLKASAASVSALQTQLDALQTAFDAADLVYIGPTAPADTSKVWVPTA